MVLISDVLFDSALRLGLPFVPSYLSVSGSVEAMIRGVNYASAGAGIIFSSGSELVQFFPPYISQSAQEDDLFSIINLGENGLHRVSIFHSHSRFSR